MYASGYMASLKQQTGGRGEDHLSPLHTKTCAPRPFGGGWGVGPAALDHIYIYIYRVLIELLPRLEEHVFQLGTACHSHLLRCFVQFCTQALAARSLGHVKQLVEKLASEASNAHSSCQAAI